MCETLDYSNNLASSYNAPVVCGAPKATTACQQSQCLWSTRGQFLCVESVSADLSACDDGNPCTLNDVCLSGTCSAGDLAAVGTACGAQNASGYQPSCSASGACSLTAPETSPPVATAPPVTSISTAAPRGNFDSFVTSMLGIYALVGYALAVGALLVTAAIVRMKRRRSGMHPFEAGSLRYAAARGNVVALECISRLPGFDVNAAHDGLTALHAASVCGRLGSVRWLLEHGADPNAVKSDTWNDTALHYAASKGFVEICETLVLHGADATKVNFQGLTPGEVTRKDRLRTFLASVARGDEDVLDSTARQAFNGLPADDEDLDYQALPSLETDIKPPDRTEWISTRRWDSYGAPGTTPYPQLRLTRFFVVITSLAAMIYIAWRATRTINDQSLPAAIFSTTLFVAELFMMTQFFCSMLLLWQPITREERDMYRMGIPKAEWPTVDIFIVTYTEPIYIIEEAIYAALNQQWPGSKLAVHVLDDGNRPEMRKLVDIIADELTVAGRPQLLSYVARPKVKGVHHHAKAGNINHTLTKEPDSLGDYVLILDCDMITAPTFLRTAMPHFFEAGPDGKWRVKEKAAMVQLPQRFHNLGPKDPWWHTAEDFNAAGFEGSDGVGATPCVGTGVIFMRECLVSIGGQSYWSVTEDFKTSSNLLSQGFSTMYLARDLVYGLAVDDVHGIQRQRIRWATGGLEILKQDFPLFRTGLSPLATVLFFANAWQYVLSVPAMIFLLAPLIYLYSNVSPVYTLLIEAGVFLGGFLLITRLLQWWQVRLISCISKDLCLWRGSQQVVWLSPLFFEALVLFVWKHLAIFKRGNKHAKFAVSAKDGDRTPWSIILRSSWFVWTFYILFVFGVVENVLLARFGVWSFSLDWWLHLGLAVLLCAYVSAMLFPIIASLLPCIEMEPKGIVAWTTESSRRNPKWIVIEDENAGVTCWGTDQFIRRNGCFGAKPESPVIMREKKSPQKEQLTEPPHVQLAPMILDTYCDTMEDDSASCVSSFSTLSHESDVILVRSKDRAYEKMRNCLSEAPMNRDAVIIGALPCWLFVLTHDQRPIFQVPLMRMLGVRTQQEVLEAMVPALNKHPRFHVPPYMQNHYKFRLVYGFMIALAAVGLPLLSVLYYGDTRFLTFEL